MKDDPSFIDWPPDEPAVISTVNTDKCDPCSYRGPGVRDPGTTTWTFTLRPFDLQG